MYLYNFTIHFWWENCFGIDKLRDFLRLWFSWISWFRDCLSTMGWLKIQLHWSGALFLSCTWWIWLLVQLPHLHQAKSQSRYSKMRKKKFWWNFINFSGWHLRELYIDLQDEFSKLLLVEKASNTSPNCSILQSQQFVYALILRFFFWWYAPWYFWII